MKRLGVLSLVVAAAIGCTQVKPIPVVAGDICSRCRRSIAEPALAGEIINANLYATKYRTPACMAQYLNDHPQENPRAIFVTDYPSKRLFAAESAHFVKTEIDAFTHEVDFAAFLSEDEAVKFGAPTGSTPIDWSGVRKYAAERVAN